MLSTHAIQHLAGVTDRVIQSGLLHMMPNTNDITDEDTNVRIHFSCQYELKITMEIIQQMGTESTIDVVWLTGNNNISNRGQNKILGNLVKCLLRKIQDSPEGILMIVGYTRAIFTSTVTNENIIYYSHPYYKGEP
jgi:hypothetical protein